MNGSGKHEHTVRKRRRPGRKDVFRSTAARRGHHGSLGTVEATGRSGSHHSDQYRDPQDNSMAGPDARMPENAVSFRHRTPKRACIERLFAEKHSVACEASPQRRMSRRGRFLCTFRSQACYGPVTEHSGTLPVCPSALSLPDTPHPKRDTGHSPHTGRIRILGGPYETTRPMDGKPRLSGQQSGTMQWGQAPARITPRTFSFSFPKASCRASCCGARGQAPLRPGTTLSYSRIWPCIPWE